MPYFIANRLPGLIRLPWSQKRFSHAAGIAIALCLVPIGVTPVLALRRSAQPVSPSLPVPTLSPAPKPTKITPPIRSHTSCPTELEPLIRAMMRDLPSYLNRIYHQNGIRQFPRYAIAASQADLNPLPVVSSSNLPPSQGGLHQAFFTMLERQYEAQDKREFQNHHWLFLAHSATGWQLAILYSRLASYPARPDDPSGLQDTTRQATGQAIRLWLRDCQAGTIQP